MTLSLPPRKCWEETPCIGEVLWDSVRWDNSTTCSPWNRARSEAILKKGKTRHNCFVVLLWINLWQNQEEFPSKGRKQTLCNFSPVPASRNSLLQKKARNDGTRRAVKIHKRHTTSLGSSLSSLVTLAIAWCSKLLQILCFPTAVASSVVLAGAKRQFPSSFRRSEWCRSKSIGKPEMTGLPLAGITYLEATFPFEQSHPASL